MKMFMELHINYLKILGLVVRVFYDTVNMLSKESIQTSKSENTHEFIDLRI